jgi:septal ring factor EnvC (AmiA/AmiB activator)
MMEVIILSKLNNKTKKDRIKYNVLFVPDKVSEGVKNFSINFDTLIIIILVVIFVVVGALMYGVIMSREYNNVNKEVDELNQQIETLNEEKQALQNENDELQEKMAILSSTINEKVQQQEQIEAEIAQAYIPNGFPIKSTATYNEDETELDGNPIAVFHASEGTSVTASASGTVESVEATASLYIVTIDHGNGYKSIYRNATKPKVVQGDSVTSDTEIFRITAGSEELGYQVTLNGEYLDPLELMEIKG